LKRKEFSSAGTRFLCTAAGVLCLILLCSVGAFAQSDNSRLSGVVKDPSGAVMPGVTVMVKLEGGALQRSAVTDERGSYMLTPLPPGNYTVIVEHTGFKRSEITGKKLDAGIPAALDIILQVGGTTETVTVIADTATVQTESATVGRLVEGKQLEYLGLNGRNPIYLAALMPGVGGDLTGNNYGSSTAPSMNGSSLGMIFFDGAVGIRTRDNGTWSIGAADMDATQEVQVLTANFSAEYGRTAGGQIRIVTRGGTNAFHGSVYDYIRNSAFNANSWSRNNSTLRETAPCSDPANKAATYCRPTPFRYNQFGWNLSGPVLIPFTSFNRDRNKLFWMFSQEWVHNRGGSTSTMTTATDKMRQGDFSELLDPTNRYSQRAVYLKDPLKTGTCSASNQTACFNYNGVTNWIPPNRLSRNGMAFLRAFPEAGDFLYPYPTSTNWTSGELASGTNQGKTTVAIDFVPNSNHSFRVRGQFFNSKPPDAVTEYRNKFYEWPAADANTWRDRPNKWISINWIWSFSPTWINESLAAASHDFVDNILDLNGNAWDRTKFGIDYPYIFPADEKEVPNKVPTVSGISRIAVPSSTPYPATSAGPIWQFSDNMTYIRGGHTMKFGVYAEKSGQNDKDQIIIGAAPGSTNNQNGQFQFSDNTLNGTGYALGNLAVGLFNTYAEVGQRSYTQFRSWDIELFFQDAWKVSQNVRVELGMRYSLIQPYWAQWGNMSNFFPRFYDPNNEVTVDPRTGLVTGTKEQRYNGMVFPGDGWPEAAYGPGRVNVANTGEYDFLFRPGEVPRGFHPMPKKDFQPRVGLSYIFNKKTVLRIGGGRFINRLGVSDGVFLGGNPPLQPQFSVNTGNVDNPGGGGGIINTYTLNPTIHPEYFPNPESWAWNVTFQRQVPFSTTVELGYVGRKSLRSQRTINNINQIEQIGAIYDPANYLPGTKTVVNLDSLRPYKGYSLVKSEDNNQNSVYHSMQLQVNRRFSKGLSFGVAYTYSQSNSNGGLTNIYDYSTAWGPYTPDHNLVINAIYEIPFLRNRSDLLGKILGGWSITAISRVTNGGTFSFSDPYDDMGVGTGAGTQYMIQNGDGFLPKDQRGYGLDKSYWQVTNPDGSLIVLRPAQSTYCKTGCARGMLYGPRSQEHNLSFTKDFRIYENQRITFRGEVFNWLNHPDWSNPGTDYRNLSTFGKINSKSSNTREVQVSLRFSF